MKVSKSHFLFFLFFLFGLIITFLAYQVLPERFFRDAETILNRNNYFKGFMGSYPFTASFYKLTGLAKLDFVFIGLIQYPIMIYLLYKVGVPKDLYKLKLKNFIIFSLFIMLAIYVSVPSKEFINFLYLYIIVYMIKNKIFSYFKTIIYTIILLLFFSYFFREYYAIVAIISIGMYLASFIKFNNYKTTSIVFGITLLIGISLSYGIIKGQYISNETRAYVTSLADSNTIITPPLQTNTWYGESISILYGFFSVNLPLNGLKYILSPHILFFVFWQLTVFFLLIKTYGRVINEGKRNNYELWLFYILFSYFIVQGVFEPDLGSALRHKASVFPIIYYLLNYESFRKKAE